MYHEFRKFSVPLAIVLGGLACMVIWFVMVEYRVLHVERAAADAPGIAAKDALNMIAHSKMPLNPVIATKPEIRAEAAKMRRETQETAEALRAKTEATAAEIKGQLARIQNAQAARDRAKLNELRTIERQQARILQLLQEQPLVSRRH